MNATDLGLDSRTPPSSVIVGLGASPKRPFDKETNIGPQPGTDTPHDTRRDPPNPFKEKSEDDDSIVPGDDDIFPHGPYTPGNRDPEK